MATHREIEVAQNTTYMNAIVAQRTQPPEIALKMIMANLRASMTQEQVAYCGKLAEELIREIQ